jgi:hypothetical protein
MCTPTEFWNNPTGCWRFKGWLFRNQDTGRNNQVSLAQIQGRTYVFFHRVEPVNNTTVGRGISRARQVCVKEVELVNNPGGTDDGEIRGVKPAANQNIANDFITLDGLTRGITKGFIHFRDEVRNDTTQARVRLTGLNPTSIAGLPARAPFRLFYFLDIEPGTNLTPVLTEQSDAFLQLARPPLRHISQRTWAVVLDYTPPATGTLSTNVGGLLTLRYDTPQFGAQPTFNKANDFSQPLDTYHTWTSRIALENTTGELLAGERPEIVIPVHVRTAVPDADGLTTFLTVANNTLDTGINNQYLKTGTLADQQTQQWIMEDARQFPYLSDDDKTRAFRLRSVSAGFYMTGNDVTRIDAQRPEFFFLLSQALRPNWDTQVWVRQPVDATPNLFRIMSAWKPYDSPPDLDDLMFLTRDNSQGNNRGGQDVFVQPEVLPEVGEKQRQKWLIDPIPVGVYFRTAVPDADQRFTYLALTSTAVHAGINGQYLNTGTPGQEWVFEPPTGFTLPPGENPANAFRVRNVQTNLYMTSNDDPLRNPHFQLLDQPLNTSWNTQIWMKEATGSGTFRMRTLFNPDNQPLFLTRNITNPSNNRGPQGVFVQPTDATNATRQIWFIE